MSILPLVWPVLETHTVKILDFLINLVSAHHLNTSINTLLLASVRHVLTQVVSRALIIVPALAVSAMQVKIIHVSYLTVLAHLDTLVI